MKNEKRREALSSEELRKRAAAYASKVVGQRFGAVYEYDMFFLEPLDEGGAYSDEIERATEVARAYMEGAKRMASELKRMGIADVVKTILEMDK